MDCIAAYDWLLRQVDGWEQHPIIACEGAGAAERKRGVG